MPMCANEPVGVQACGEILNISTEMTESEIRINWGRMMLSAPLATGKCPKCGYSSGSDYNARWTPYILTDDKMEMTGEVFFNKERKTE